MRSRRSNNISISLFSFQDIITSVTGIMILLTIIMLLDLITRSNASPRAQTEQVLPQINEELSKTNEIIKDLEEKLSRQSSSTSTNAFLSEETLNKKIADLEEKLNHSQKKIEKLQQEKKNIKKSFDRINTEKNNQDKTVVVEKLKNELKEKKKELEDLSKSKRIIYNSPEGISKTTWLFEVSGSNILVAKIGETSKPHNFNGAEPLKRWISTRSPSNDYFMILFKPDSVSFHDSLLNFLESNNFDFGYDLLDSSRTAIDPDKGAGY